MLIAGVHFACIVGIVVYLFVTSWRPLAQLPPGIIPAIPPAVDVDKWTIRGREGWDAEDFFSDPDALRAANAIVAHNIDGLKRLIETGLDVNLSGKAGMTLLFWAMVTDNRPAFDLLLDSGADPDKRLYGMIIPERSALTFAAKDTVFFASLKISRGDYFLAALKHTQDVNQRDVSGDTFLHACTKISWVVHTATRRQVLQPLIDAGIDLNARDQYGCTAAYYAVAHDAGFCLQLLQAGADPEIHSDQGVNFADRLSVVMNRYQKRGQTGQLAAAQLVKQWLESNQKESE